MWVGYLAVSICQRFPFFKYHKVLLLTTTCLYNIGLGTYTLLCKTESKRDNAHAEYSCKYSAKLGYFIKTYYQNHASLCCPIFFTVQQTNLKSFKNGLALLSTFKFLNKILNINMYIFFSFL